MKPQYEREVTKKPDYGDMFFNSFNGLHVQVRMRTGDIFTGVLSVNPTNRFHAILTTDEGARVLLVKGNISYILETKDGEGRDEI